MANPGNQKKPGKTMGVLCEIEAQLQEVSALLGDDADDSVKKRLQETIELASSVNHFASSKSTPVSPLLKYILEETAKLDFDRLRSEGKLISRIPNIFVMVMITETGQVQFLQFLIRTLKAKSILEVGTYLGYAAFGMAEVMAPGGKVTGIDYEPYFCNFVNETAKKRNLNVEALEGSALAVLTTLAKEGKKYDFIYVDCNKMEYCDYYKIIMDNNMLHKEGMIVADNVLWSGEAITKKGTGGIALDDFSNMVLSDERVTSVMLPCYDGLLLIQHK